jgi:hypothetical protein
LKEGKGERGEGREERGVRRRHDVGVAVEHNVGVAVELPHQPYQNDESPTTISTAIIFNHW